MKIKLLSLLIIPFVFSSSYASVNNSHDNPLKNFYIGASAGLGFYSSGYYSGTFFDYSPYVGYNFKGFDIPARVELGYDVITGGGINAYYDFHTTKSEKEFSPYIMAGAGSGGFTAGAGVNYNIDNNWDIDLGARYGYSKGQTYTINYPISYSYSTSYSGVSLRAGARYTF